MTVEELGHECEKYDCDDCPYITKCHKCRRFCMEYLWKPF